MRGCKQALSFYHPDHNMDDCAEIEIRTRLIFLFLVLEVNTITGMDGHDHSDENPDPLVAQAGRRRPSAGCRAESKTGTLQGGPEPREDPREVISRAVSPSSQPG